MSECGKGFVFCKAVKVDSLIEARVSSGHASPMAPLKSLSSNLAETRAARDRIGSHLGLGLIKHWQDEDLSPLPTVYSLLLLKNTVCHLFQGL